MRKELEAYVEAITKLLEVSTHSVKAMNFLGIDIESKLREIPQSMNIKSTPDANNNLSEIQAP